MLFQYNQLFKSSNDFNPLLDYFSPIFNLIPLDYCQVYNSSDAIVLLYPF